MGVLPVSLALMARTSDIVDETVQAHQPQKYDYPADSLVYAVLPGFMIGIAIVAAALRLWTRARILRRLTMDDWLLMIAQILAVATLALWLYARAVERNYAPGSPELLENTAWPLFTAELLYFISNTALKMSCGLFFLRLPQSRLQRNIYIGTMAAFMLCTLITGFVICFRCSSFSLVDMMFSNSCTINWNVVEPLWLLATLSNAAIDWVFALVPLHMALTTGRRHFWTNLRNKTWVCILGSIGLAGSIISLARIPTITSMRFDSATIHQHYPLVFLLYEIEQGLCATAVSLLGIRPIAEPLNKWKEAFMGQKLAINGQDPEAKAAQQMDSPKFTTSRSNPTVSYSDIKVDHAALSKLGVLPDCTGSVESLHSLETDTWWSAPTPLQSSTVSRSAGKGQNSTIGSLTLASIVEVRED
ncbi:hypothetical protein MBLNU457_4680t3 [Dothideomycetes sp. NU457]